MPRHNALKISDTLRSHLYIDPNDVTTWIGQKAYYRDHLDEYGIRVIKSVKHHKQASRNYAKPIFEITWDNSTADNTEGNDRYCLVQRHGGYPYCEIGEQNCCDILLAESEE